MKEIHAYIYTCKNLENKERCKEEYSYPYLPPKDNHYIEVALAGVVQWLECRPVQ